MPVATVRMFGSKITSVGEKADLVDQQVVRALADPHLVLDRRGLPLLVEGHDDDRGAVAPDQPGVVQELGFAFLEADRIDDRLALHAFQAGFDDRPLRAVDHERHAADVGLGGQQVEEPAPSTPRH